MFSPVKKKKEKKKVIFFLKFARIRLICSIAPAIKGFPLASVLQVCLWLISCNILCASCRLLTWNWFPESDGSRQYQHRWLPTFQPSAEPFPRMSKSFMLPSVLLSIFPSTSRHSPPRSPGSCRSRRTSHYGWWGPRRWSWSQTERQEGGMGLAGARSQEPWAECTQSCTRWERGEARKVSFCFCFCFVFNSKVTEEVKGKKKIETNNDLYRKSR